MAQWIKPNINIDFIGRRKFFWTASTVAVATSIIALIANAVFRGDALNYGTDFKGGTQLVVEFTRDVKSGDVRRALKKGGFGGAEVVSVQDAKHTFMLRLAEASVLDKAATKSVHKHVVEEFKGHVARIRHKEGSDKVTVKLKKDVTVDNQDDVKTIQARLVKAFKNAGVVTQTVQLAGRLEDRNFRIQLAGLKPKVTKTFDKELGAGVVSDIPQVETVSEKMGKKLRDDGITAVMYALLLMLVYIALRFDFRYAPGAVVALVHDILITLGLFSVLWIEFSLPVVAALLTIAGYSINDTIVVYDRVRENLAKMRDRKLDLVVNTSINETLGRTLLTSVTTLFTCVAILVLGTGVLKVFAFALVAGVIVGTYSSIFIASPLVVLLSERFAAAKRRAGARA